MFQFTGFPPIHYVFMYGRPDITLAGLPHSEIHGSMPVCGSPWLIAAYHVLHRLLMPRHSPYALFRLIVDLFIVPKTIALTFSKLYGVSLHLTLFTSYTFVHEDLKLLLLSFFMQFSMFFPRPVGLI